jgi:hypothetical protein
LLERDQERVFGLTGDDLLFSPEIKSVMAVVHHDSRRGQLRPFRHEHVRCDTHVWRGLKRQVLVDVVAPVNAPNQLCLGGDARRCVQEQLEDFCPRCGLPVSKTLELRTQIRELEWRAIRLRLDERVEVPNMRFSTGRRGSLKNRRFTRCVRWRSGQKRVARDQPFAESPS